jgi:hypothetical protein
MIGCWTFSPNSSETQNLQNYLKGLASEVLRQLDFSGKNGKIVLCFPRKILAELFSSPYKDSAMYPCHRYRSGQPIPNTARIILVTDGTAVNAVTSGLFSPDWLYLLDEFHELNGQKLALFQVLLERNIAQILLSATPVDLPGVEVNYYETPLPRRFTPDVYEYPDGMSLVDVYVQYVSGRKEWAEQSQKMLIKTTYLSDQKNQNGVNQVLEGLQYHGIQCHVLHGGNASEPIDPTVQCIIATEVISTGISIPGRHMLITDGMMHADDKGIASHTWTDAPTEYQTDGRVGRYGKGDIVLRPKSAGTGSKPLRYTSVSYLQFYMNAENLHLPQMIEFANIKLPPWFKRRYVVYPELPYLAFNAAIATELRGYLAMYYGIFANGTPERSFRAMWEQMFEDQPPEELEWLVPLRDRCCKGFIKPDIVISLLGREKHCIWALCNRTDETETARSSVLTPGELDFEPSPEKPDIDKFYFSSPCEPFVPLEGALRPLGEARVSLKGRLKKTNTTITEVSTIEEAYQQLEEGLSKRFKAAMEELEQNAATLSKNRFIGRKVLEDYRKANKRSLQTLAHTATTTIGFGLNKRVLTSGLPNGVLYVGPSSKQQIHQFTQIAGSCEICQENQKTHVHFKPDTESLPDVFKEKTTVNIPYLYQYLSYDFTTEENSAGSLSNSQGVGGSTAMLPPD